MLTCLSRAPNWLPGWGLSLLLLAAPASAQLLTSLLGNDTRRLMVSNTSDPWAGWPDLIGGADRPGPRLELQSRYDDVFRERGAVRRNDVNRWEHRAVLKIPLGPKRGRLDLNFRQVQTEIDSRPLTDQSIRLGSNQQRLGLGYGRPLTGSGLHGVLAVEATELDGDWFPGYSLGLTTAPRYGLRLSLAGGRRFDGQTATWRFEDLSFPGSVTYRENWWGLRVIMKPVDWLRLESAYRQGAFGSTRNPVADGIRFDPRLHSNSWHLGLRAQPGDGRLGGGIRLWSMAAEGTGKFFDAGRQFGYLAETEVSERRLQLWVDRRGPRGTLRVQFDRQRLTATASGHLEPWPFSDNIFDQLYTIYFLDRTEVSLDRWELGFIRDAAGRTDWDFKLGYILVKPANKLVWQQRLFFVFMGEIHREELNLAAAELLVPSAAKTWRLGPAEFTYAFTQVIPIRVRLRREPAPGIPREKTSKRGGGYHRLKLTYDW